MSAAIRAEPEIFWNRGKAQPVYGSPWDDRRRGSRANQCPQAQFRILGDGPLRTGLEEHARRLGINGAIHFEGESLDVPGFLAGLDVFVMGSKSEGLPLAMLEAMAAGLPIVSTAVGGSPELIEDGVSGWLCPPAEPDSLADAMMQATCADRYHIGERAKNQVFKSHTIEKMAVGYETLFGEIVEGRRSRMWSGR